MLCLDENLVGLTDRAEGILDGRQATLQVAFFFELVEREQVTRKMRK